MLETGAQQHLLKLIREGSEKKIEEFFAEQGDAKIDLNFKDEYGNYALIMELIYKNNLNILELFLQHSIDVNLIDKKGNDGWFYAITLPDNGQTALEITQMLFKYAQPINHNTKKIHYQPLHECARRGYTELAEVYLKKGAKVNQRDYYGYTPLTWAVKEDSIEFVKFLLEHGASINTKSFYWNNEKDKFTPLEYALDNLYSVKPEIVALLKLETAFKQNKLDSLLQEDKKITQKDAEDYLRWKLPLAPNYNFIKFIKDGTIPKVEVQPQKMNELPFDKFLELLKSQISTIYTKDNGAREGLTSEDLKVIGDQSES